MKDLKTLSDHDLWSETKSSALTEKKATLVLLEYLSEVQRRRLFAKRGYGSLFTYVVQELGYSEAQASERIGALRLMTDIPEVKAKIEIGSLSLTTASQIQRFLKSEPKPLTPDEKLELIVQCEGQSKRKVEKVLAENSGQPPEAIELKLRAGAKLLDQINEVRAIEGHHMSVEEILERALASHLEKLKKLPTRIPTEKGARPAKLQIGPTRYISFADRAEVITRSEGQCEFRDLETGRRCESRFRLQFEHQVPHAAGGTNTSSNLKRFCPVHNQLTAIQFFGAQKMSKWIPGLK